MVAMAQGSTRPPSPGGSEFRRAHTPAVARLAPGSAAPDRAALRRVAGEFEAFFLGMVLKQMRAAVPKSELFHGGRGEEMFQELLDGEYAKRLAERGGIGLADLMVEQLAKRNRGAKQYAGEGTKP